MRLTAIVRRWRQRRQAHRADARDRQISARENLRDFKNFTGDGLP
jgi:hypothetical protein